MIKYKVPFYDEDNYSKSIEFMKIKELIENFREAKLLFKSEDYPLKEKEDNLFLREVSEISINIENIIYKLDKLIMAMYETNTLLRKIIQKIPDTLSEKTESQRMRQLVKIWDRVGKKSPEELPSFDNVDDQLRYVKEQLKKIGSISKRSAIEP